MRHFLTIAMLVNFAACAQNLARVNFSFSRNLDIYKPYSKHEDANLESGAIISGSWALSFQRNIYQNERLDIRAGVTYRRTNHLVKDRLKIFNYYNGPNLVEYQYDDPADLKSRSNAFGLNLDFTHRLFQSKHWYNGLGAGCEIFILEYFKSNYISSDAPINDITGTEMFPQPLLASPNRHLYISSANVSVFYRATWITAPEFNLGFKVGIGTNIYSDWDQFKRYAWVGAGIEIGMGQVNQKNNPTNK